MRESELRALIVRDENTLGLGIMHKRSLMGILESLKGLNILEEEEGVYYAAWHQERKVKTPPCIITNPASKNDQEEETKPTQ